MCGRRAGRLSARAGWTLGRGAHRLGQRQQLAQSGGCRACCARPCCWPALVCLGPGHPRLEPLRQQHQPRVAGLRLCCSTAHASCSRGHRSCLRLWTTRSPPGRHTSTRPPGCTPLSSAACRRDCSPARPGRPPCSPPCHSGDSWPVRSYRELGCRRRVLCGWARIDSSRRGCRCTCFQPAGAGAVFARGVRTISPAPNIVRSLASRYQSVPLFVRLNSAAVIHCTTSSGSDAARHFLAVSAWLPASSPPSPLVPSRAQLPPWQLAAHLSARRLRGVPRAAPRSAHPAARHSQCPLPGAPASWSQPEFESRPYMVGLESGLYRHLRSLISWIQTFDNSIIHLFGASGFENGGLNQQSYSMNSIIRPVNVINKSNSHRPRATQLPSDSHLAQHFKLSGRKTPPSIPCIHPSLGRCGPSGPETGHIEGEWRVLHPKRASLIAPSSYCCTL